MTICCTKNIREDIIKIYSDIIETWKTQNISNRIRYDKNTFKVTKIQANIDLVKTRLTNFDLDGNFLLEWDCSYIVRKEDDRWLISVGTTNNKTSKTKFLAKNAAKAAISMAAIDRRRCHRRSSKCSKKDISFSAIRTGLVQIIRFFAQC